MTMVVSSKLSTSSTPETVQDSPSLQNHGWAATGRNPVSPRIICILIRLSHSFVPFLWDRAVRYASQWERARLQGPGQQSGDTAIFKKSPGR
jgi:hypothetical protein